MLQCIPLAIQEALQENLASAANSFQKSVVLPCGCAVARVWCACVQGKREGEEGGLSMLSMV